MRIERQIDQIIQTYLPLITRGEETVESVLEKNAQIAEQLKPSLEAAAWISQARHITEPRQGYIPASRQYLEEKIAAQKPLSPWQRLLGHFTPQRWFFNLAAPILVIAMLALVVNNALLTARLSIPGEPLYGTKLFVEDLQLAFTFDPVRRTELNIQNSRQRTTEFVELVLEGQYDALPSAADRLEAGIISSLYSLDRISTQQAAMEQATLLQFRDSLSNEVSLLTVLKSTSPQSAHPGIDLAIQVAQSGILALR